MIVYLKCITYEFKKRLFPGKLSRKDLLIAIMPKHSKKLSKNGIIFDKLIHHRGKFIVIHTTSYKRGGGKIEGREEVWYGRGEGGSGGGRVG